MDTTKKANEFIKKGVALLPDDAKTEWKAQASDIFINDAIDAAIKELEKPSDPNHPEMYMEKVSMLEAYSVQEANRMASTLWRLQLLPEDLEKEYRELPSMAEIVQPYNNFLASRQARMDELNEKGKELQWEKQEMEIFMGVINGVPTEESEKRYEEFKKTQQAALAGGR